MSNNTVNVVILGAGTGGTIVANKLNKKLKKTKKPFQLTVIDPSFKHVYQPGFLFTMFKKDKTHSIVKDGKKLLPKNTNMIEEKVKKVETKDKVVITESGTKVPYDYLVIATGAKLSPEKVDWWDDSLYHYYSPEAADRLSEKIENFREGKIIIAIGEIPYKCPPAPIEGALLLDDYFKKKGIRDKVEIQYCSPLDRAFSIKTVNEVIEPIMNEKGIEVETFFNVDDVDTEEKVLYSLEGSDLDYDLLIMIPPHTGQPFLHESGIAGKSGWVPTDRETLRVQDQENMYALGDTTDIPTSKAGSTAHYEAPIIAENIYKDIIGDTNLTKYDGHVQCFFLTEFGKSLFIDFNFEHPPKPGKPSRFWWWFKLFFKPFYFRAVAKGLV